MHRIAFKALVWKWLVFFLILPSLDVFESDCREKNSKQLLSKVSSEAAVGRCSSA